MHLARRREDALDPRRGGRRGEVLLDHLGECRPLGLLGLPPLKYALREHVHLEVDLPAKLYQPVTCPGRGVFRVTYIWQVTVLKQPVSAY